VFNLAETMQLQSLDTPHTETLAELQRYKLLVESVQDYAIFLIDPAGYVLTWNKGAERFKGYKPHEIIGQHFSKFYLQPDIDAKKPERELELARQRGRMEDEDWRVRKDGSQFWANVVITALYDEDKSLVGFAKVTRDLTDRKQHEEELRRANILLQEQQRALEQLNSSKDEFISLASHQLRTPATSVKQFLGMIIEGFVGELTAEQMSFVQKAYDSNDHQIDIVNSLLQVAQIDGGKVVLRKAIIDIQQLVKSVIEEYCDNFTRRQQKVRINIPRPVNAYVDVGYFRMVLENLIDNASKYTPAGGDIKISARTAKGFLVIIIQDTGVGIDPKDQAKLFEKFTRIPNELSDAVGGTGLGLYWARQVIALHGGRVELTSRVGRGTTFSIYIPSGESDNA
jgi:PAS domain S-box-containing protein